MSLIAPIFRLARRGLVLPFGGVDRGNSTNGLSVSNREDLMRRLGKINRSALKYSLGGVLIALSAQGLAYAQGAGEEETIDTVVVTGIKGSQIQNLDIKRNAGSFVDAITALDIGKYPDKNIADALQRVPGVSITRTGGEGQFVSIRGTDPELTFTQLNGNYVATGSTNRDPQRSFNFALLPANLIARTEVHKTPQAKLDEGGVGGTVIVHTRKPLDMDAFSGFLNAEFTYSDTTDKFEPQYGGLVSWKNEAETFGVLFSYTAQDRTTIVESVRTENWRMFDTAMVGIDEFAQDSLFDTAGNEITGFAPFAVVQEQNDEERNREGIQGTLQWSPTDRFEATFNYLGATFQQNNDQNLMLLAEWDYRDPAIVPGTVRMNGDTIVAMQLADPNLADTTVDLQAPAVGSQRRLSEATSNTYDLELSYFGDMFTGVFNAGFTRSEGGASLNLLQRFNGQGGVTSAYGWDLEADTIINADQDRVDFNTFGWASHDAGQSTDEEFYAQLDFEIEKSFGFFETFDVGVKYRDHAITRRLVNQAWDDGDPNNADMWGGCCGLGWSYWHTIPQRPSASEIGSFIKVVDGLTGNAGTQRQFATLDWDAHTAWLDDNFVRITNNDDGFFFNVDEEILAGYVQGNYALDRLSGNVGVRIVHTKQASETFNSVDGARDAELTRSSGNTTEILPSFNAKYDLTDDVVLRGAIARVIARQPYADLGRSEGFAIPAAGSNTSTGTKGNPDLKPYDAWQFDAGVEWYFADASFLGATVFHKEISSFITNGEVIEQRTVPTRTTPIEVVFSLPVNGEDATSTGLEVYYQQAFDFGGGIITNYTFTDTSKAANIGGVEADRPLPGTSKHQMNITLYYENEDFEVRASYNYRDDTPGAVDTGQVVYQNAYGQVDVTGSYYLTEGLSLNASVINLTKSAGERYWGESHRLYGRNYDGRRLYVGANLRF